jgi:hypothetical protein
MTSVEVQPKTEFSQNFVKGFFNALPCDGTKSNTEYARVIPATGFKGDTSSINFVLAEVEPPFCYDLAKTLIQVKIKIVDATTERLPLKSASVAGINNMLHSLFSSCKVKLNDTPITQNEGNYFYKAYLENLLSFSDSIKKHGWLSCVGWTQESGPEFNMPEWLDSRSVYFREYFSIDGNWSENGATLTGKANPLCAFAFLRRSFLR